MTAALIDSELADIRANARAFLALTKRQDDGGATAGSDALRVALHNYINDLPRLLATIDALRADRDRIAKERDDLKADWLAAARELAGREAYGISGVTS